MLPISKKSNDKPRKYVRKISARRLREEYGGKVPYSTIQRSKRIPPRKKRTGTPIRSTPWPNALDPKSYVLDGRTVLYGKDLENLRREVFIRAFGMCEAKQHVYDCPLAVGWRDGELDHIRARGNGGGFRDDTKQNTRWLSSACHKAKHGQY